MFALRKLRQIDDDDHFEDYNTYEGGDDKAADTEAAKPADPPAATPAAAKPDLDKNGLPHVTPHEHVVKSNPCVECFKRIFSKLFPYQSVTTFTEWGHLLKNYLLAATILHAIFFGVAIAMIGFQPMIYTMFLGLVCYSCYLTLNNCSICLYMTGLVLSISGGVTWACSYTGQAAATTLHCTKNVSG